MFYIRFFKKKWRILTAYFKKAEGFNLIELTTVIVIIGILSGISFPFYRLTRQRLALHRAVSKLTQDIRKAQEMAMSAEDFPGGLPSTGGYGIYVQTGVGAAIYLYANTNNSTEERYESPGDTIIKKIYKEDENIYIEKGIKLEEIVPDSSGVFISNVSVNFRPPDPIVKIKDAGTEYNEKVTVTFCIEGSDCSNSINYKEIIVNRVGLIYVIE